MKALILILLLAGCQSQTAQTRIVDARAPEQLLADGIKMSEQRAASIQWRADQIKRDSDERLQDYQVARGLYDAAGYSPSVAARKAERVAYGRTAD